MIWKIPYCRENVFGWLDMWYHVGKCFGLVPYKRVLNNFNEYEYMKSKLGYHNTLPIIGKLKTKTLSANKLFCLFN